MTLFFCNSGPLMSYRSGLLNIQDLNPEVQTHWRMSRLEMIKTGLRFIFAGLRP